MERVAATLKDKLKTSEGGSFNFAISLIIACLSVLYKMKNYAESNLLSRYMFMFLFFITMISTAVLLFIGLYIIFKALSLETTDYKIRKYQENVAKKFYLTAFNSAFYCVICAFIFTIFLIIPEDLKSRTDFMLFMFFLVMVFLYSLFKLEIFKPSFIINIPHNASNNDMKNYVINNLKYIYFCLFAVVLVSFVTLPFITSNHIVVALDSVYYKQDKQIPLDIFITGFPHSEVYVNLYHADSELFGEIDSIKIQRSCIYQSAYLYSNYIDRGKYKVFINCSNLKEGYYVLSVSDRLRDAPDQYGRITGESYFNLNKSVNNSFYLIEKR